MTDLEAIFERAPRLAERLAHRAGEEPAAIVGAAREEIARLSEAEQIAVLNAHPRIGADPATLSAFSRGEQGANGAAMVMADLARLNDEYERRFGFRFVVFVGGRSKAAIVPILRQRLSADRREELARGLEEFLAITEDRLLKARS